MAPRCDCVVIGLKTYGPKGLAEGRGQTLETVRPGWGGPFQVHPRVPYCVAITAPLAATLFGLSTTQALVVLFVVLPFALAAVIFPLVAWRSSRAGGDKPVLTSEILATGRPAQARIVSVRPLGSVLDMRPMVSFHLDVRTPPGPPRGAPPGASGPGGQPFEPFELEVIQSFPRSVMRQFRPGDMVEVRLTPDLSRGAVVWNPAPPGY